MAVTPVTGAGPFNTLIDRLAEGINQRLNLTVISEDGKGHRVTVCDVRAAAREAIAAIIADIRTNDTNTTVRTRLTSALNAIDPNP